MQPSNFERPNHGLIHGDAVCVENQGKVDALHVHLNNLRELKAQLEESVAPLLKEYVAHTSGFSLHQMQVKSLFPCFSQ